MPRASTLIQKAKERCPALINEEAPRGPRGEKSGAPNEEAPRGPRGEKSGAGKRTPARTFFCENVTYLYSNCKLHLDAGMLSHCFRLTNACKNKKKGILPVLLYTTNVLTLVAHFSFFVCCSEDSTKFEAKSSCNVFLSLQ